MSKRLLLVLGLMSVTGALGYDFTGISFFSNPPPFQTASPERIALYHYEFLSQREEGLCGAVQVVPFGGHSIGDGLQRYFGLFDESILRVKETKQTVPSSVVQPQLGKQIDASHFNIETASPDSVFESKICFNPVHKFAGVGFTWAQRIGECYWAEVSFPVYRVENIIEFSETIINDGGGAVDETGLDGVARKANVTEALVGPNWKFGRWCPNVKRSKTGVGDVEVKLGWESYDNGDAHFRSYIGGVFPTGNKPDPVEFFAPVVGNNQHYGVMFGSNMGFELTCWGDHTLRNEIDTMGRYLFPNRQFRAFDLKDKQWSRYQELYGSEAQAAEAVIASDPNSGVSGINVLMREVEVRPRFSTTFNTAMIYEYCDSFQIELGYNFFARQGEEIHFNADQCESACHSACRTGAALKHLLGEGRLTQSRTIGKNFQDDEILFSDTTYNEVAITCCDLNVNSGAHPPMIAQTFYGAIGYQCDWSCPTTLSVGGSYQWAHNSAGMERWMLWGKVVVDF